jgi:hypothetical protein
MTNEKIRLLPRVSPCGIPTSSKRFACKCPHSIGAHISDEFCRCGLDKTFEEITLELPQTATP